MKLDILKRRFSLWSVMNDSCDWLKSERMYNESFSNVRKLYGTKQNRLFMIVCLFSFENGKEACTLFIAILIEYLLKDIAHSHMKRI